MANPKISVPTSAIPTDNGDNGTSSTRIPPSLFSDITSALLSVNAIPRIQAALQNELDAVGWTSRVQKRVLQLLREGRCSTYNDVMTVILAEVKSNTDGDGKDTQDDDYDGDSGQDADADADGDDNEDGDRDEKDKSDRDAENDEDGSAGDGDDDDGDDDDEDDKDDRGSMTGKATNKSRRKSNASNAVTVDGTSGNASAGNKKRKAKSEASGGDNKIKTLRHRQQLDTKGIRIPKKAVKEGLSVVRKELEKVCEIVPDSESNG